MEVFPAYYFTYATKYPESGSRLQLGRSYLYSTEAEGPDQRRFVLELQGMCRFLTDEDTPDRDREINRNLWVLEDFYIVHRLAKDFYFDHPVYGRVVCKFNRPLEIPPGVKGGGGVVPDFEVELIEIP